MKTILVTGASGLIGIEVTKSLLSKGYNVVGTDKIVNDLVGQKNYSFVQADITDKHKIQTVINSQRFSAVVHLANSVDNDISTFITNSEIANSKECDKYFYKALVTSGVKDIFLLSTTQVYAVPKTREPLNESAPIKVSTLYAKIKEYSENALLSAVKKSDTKHIIMRVAQIYTKDFTQNLLDKVYDNKTDTGFIYGEGEYGFCFCCLYNLIDFINAILAGPQGHYAEIYNICDAKLTLAKDIVEMERQSHKIGVVLQRTGGVEVVKSLATGLNVARKKADYRYVDLTTITNNICFDNTKAKRFSPFRWNITNTK